MIKDLLLCAAAAGLSAQNPDVWSFPPDKDPKRTAALYFCITIVGIIAIFFL